MAAENRDHHASLQADDVRQFFLLKSVLIPMGKVTVGRAEKLRQYYGRRANRRSPTVVAGLHCPSWARTRTLLIHSPLAQETFQTTCWESATFRASVPASRRSLPALARRNYGETTTADQGRTRAAARAP
jgi:hypothetical protein